MKFISTILLAITLFFTGCEQKYFDRYFSEKIHTEKVMSHFKKGLIKYNRETKILLQAVFLSHIDSEKYSDGEYFFVGLFINNDEEKDGKNYLNSSDNRLLLNGEAPSRVVELDKNSQLYKNMPMVSEWSRYYMVRFEKSSRKSNDLTFENDLYGKALLKF